MTVPVAARLMGISVRMGYRAVANGTLPAVRISGTTLVPVVELYRLADLPLPIRPVSPVLR